MKDITLLSCKNMRSLKTEGANQESFILDLVMLSHNGLHATRDFLRHLSNNTSPDLLNKIRIIWIDNGSSDGTPRYLENKFVELGLNVILVISSSNLGVIGGRNLGLKISKEIMSKSDYLMFLDNDQYVQEGWLRQHMNVMKEGDYDFIGVEAWKCNHRFLPVVKLDTQINRAINNVFNYVGCGGTMMKREVFNKVGYLDDIFNPCYFEDPDYTIRVFNEGFKIGWNIKARIVHMPHQTLGTLEKPEKTKRFIESMKKFQRKWNGKSMPVLKMPMLEVFKDENSNSS